MAKSESLVCDTPKISTGARLENARLYEGEQVCSAAPALSGFEMAVSAVFELNEG